jgi:HPt (histidine-containing phosphotransfer) domain-containing protein
VNELDAKLAVLSARFAQRAAADRADLAEALANDDRATVRDIAHKLAGLAGMLGHPNVTDLALSLEAAVEDGRSLAAPASALDAALGAIEADRPGTGSSSS